MPVRGMVRPSDPFGDWFAVTPNDDVDLPPHRALWVSVAGEVHAMNGAGDTLLVGDLPAGAVIPGRWRRLMEATTATVLRGT